MDIWQAIVIAIVEGLTEFLPVSSTGHIMITQHILGIPSSDFVKAFTVIIQFGAIVSVICLYWKRFFVLNRQIPEHLYPHSESLSLLQRCSLWLKRMAIKYDFYLKLLIGFIPAAVLGLLFSEQIDALLENIWVVASMLVAGGLFMLFIDSYFAGRKKEDTVTHKKSFWIGCFQCIAMIPGVSRSMATIVGGMFQKLTRKTAAEFSFFLAVPTMAAASGYKLLKLLTDEQQRSLLMESQNLWALIAGNIVAFAVALLAIKFFIGFVSKYGFKLFGWYRIAAGIIIFIVLLAGHQLEIK
jgi:undecaprenyl-diphosphatase